MSRDHYDATHLVTMSVFLISKCRYPSIEIMLDWHPRATRWAQQPFLSPAMTQTSCPWCNNSSIQLDTLLHNDIRVSWKNVIRKWWGGEMIYTCRSVNVGCLCTSCCVVWCIFTDYFSLFPFWFCHLTCGYCVTLFVDLKFLCPVSFLFSLLHWTPECSFVVYLNKKSLHWISIDTLQKSIWSTMSVISLCLPCTTWTKLPKVTS